MNQKSPIEELKQEITHNDPVPHQKKIIKDTSLPNKKELEFFNPEQKRKNSYVVPKHRFLNTVFFISLAFFLVVFGYMVYRYKFADSVISNRKIEVHVVTPSVITSGKDALFTVSINNDNKAALMKPEVVTTITEINQSKTAPLLDAYEKEVNISLPDIGSEAVVNQNVPLLFIGSAGKKFLVESQLQYSLPDSVARFTKELLRQEVIITNNPIAITPKLSEQKIVEGQEYTTSFTLQNTDANDFNNIALRISAPEGTSAQIQEAKSFEGGNTYPIGLLKSRELQSFTLNGIVDDRSQDVSVVTIEVVALKSLGSEEIESVLSKNTITFTKEKPFITARLNGNESQLTVIPLRDITTSFTVKNNSKEDLQDIEIRLSSTGDIINKQSLGSDNASSVGTGEIVYSRFTDDRLSSLKVGESISLPLKFSSNPVVSRQFLTENPESNLIANIQARNSSLETFNLKDYQVGKVQGQTTAELNFYTIPSTAGTFVESGAFPLTVGSTSQMLVRFEVKNTSNTLSGTKVSFKLPYYVSFGQNKTLGENVSYNDIERTVNWNIGELTAGAGVIEGTERALTLSLFITPVVSQIDQVVPLTSEVTLSGTDTLTKKAVQVKRPSLKPSYDGVNEDQIKVQRR